MKRCWIYPLLLAAAGLFSQGSVRREHAPIVCSVLLRDRTGQRLAVVNCRDGEPQPPRVQLSLKRFRGLYRDMDAMATGAAGRFWVLGSWSTSLLVVDAKTLRCRYTRLHRFETEAGGYLVAGIMALSRHQLFVGHNYGSFILDPLGRVVAQIDEPPRVLYKPMDGRWVPDTDRDDSADVTSGKRLVPAAVANGFIGGFSEDYFSIIDRALRQHAAFQFAGSVLLGAAPLTDRSWLILGEREGSRELWTALVNGHGGGRPPRLLPMRLTNLSQLAPLCSAVTPARIWMSSARNGRPGGSILVFRRSDGRFLGTRVMDGSACVLGARGDLVYLTQKARGRERLIEAEGSTLRARQTWDMPVGGWEVAAFAFLN